MTQTAAAAPAAGLFRRPKATTGFWSWFTTVDHKKIGILYGATALLFLVVGGVEALLIRLQLIGPDLDLLTESEYNQLFTMHGTTMVFLVVMPLAAAFGNYLVPIMIGARDVAFPRLNGFGYWTFLAGGIFLYSSFFFGGASDGGWFGYAPNTGSNFSPGHGVDYWILGLVITGVASMTAAVNFIVTTINLRAPGMTMMRLPMFVWMNLVVAFLLLFSMPIVTVALIELFFDRQFGSNYFNASMGGDPLLWQHLFWLFGHPEVYILILPAMGIVSEVLPVFSRKPLFGYRVVVFSGIAIGFMGWGVWAHHMFVTGLGSVATSAFAASTMFIAVPTGVKIFNWLATVWGGKVTFKTPMLFALGFIALFTIGGLSGVTHSVVPADSQQTDTYYVVAHFHYVLFGGALFGIFSGLYFWFPKMTGRLMGEGLGKLHFWLMFIGMNMAFGPMHILGLQGQPRRTHSYPEGMGWDVWNLVATIGALTIALSILVYLVNLFKSLRHGALSGDDPWDARSLEWSIPSPTPEYNFAEVPTVHELDEFWHRKYTEDDEGRAVPLPAPAASGADQGEVHVHLPSPSYFPLLTSLALPVIAYGVLYRWWWVAGLGGVMTLWMLSAWGMEPPDEPEPEGSGPEHVDAATPAEVTAGAH